MKKILVVLALCLVSVVIYPHNLLFKGYKISGNAWTMKTNLEGKGFRYEHANDSHIHMYGTYLGCAGSLVRLYKTDNTSTLYAIQVVLKREPNYSLMGQYNSVKSILTSKYGHPVEAEEFERNYAGSFSNSCRWVLSDGEIVLCISSDDYYLHLMFLPYGWRNLRNSELVDDL